MGVPAGGDLLYRGQMIRVDASGGLICLTDLWEAEGHPAEKDPTLWVKLAATQSLLRQLSTSPTAPPRPTALAGDSGESGQLITVLPGLLEIGTGEKAGQLYSALELCIAYARFLSAECYEWSLAALAERRDEASPLTKPGTAEAMSRPPSLSRRALLAAGWSVPTVLVIMLLPEKVFAHTDAMLSDGGHIDSSL